MNTVRRCPFSDRVNPLVRKTQAPIPSRRMHLKQSAQSNNVSGAFKFGSDFKLRMTQNSQWSFEFAFLERFPTSASRETQFVKLKLLADLKIREMLSRVAILNF